MANLTDAKMQNLREPPRIPIRTGRSIIPRAVAIMENGEKRVIRMPSAVGTNPFSTTNTKMSMNNNNFVTANEYVTRSLPPSPPTLPTPPPATLSTPPPATLELPAPPAAPAAPPATPPAPTTDNCSNNQNKKSKSNKLVISNKQSKSNNMQCEKSDNHKNEKSQVYNYGNEKVTIENLDSDCSEDVIKDKTITINPLSAGYHPLENELSDCYKKQECVLTTSVGLEEHVESQTISKKIKPKPKHKAPMIIRRKWSYMLMTDSADDTVQPHNNDDNQLKCANLSSNAIPTCEPPLSAISDPQLPNYMLQNLEKNYNCQKCASALLWPTTLSTHNAMLEPLTLKCQQTDAGASGDCIKSGENRFNLTKLIQKLNKDKQSDLTLN